MTWLRGPGESSSEGRVIEEAALSRAGACAYSALCYHNWTHCPSQSAQDTGLSGQVLCISRELGTRCGSTHLWSWHIESRRFLQASLGYIECLKQEEKKKKNAGPPRLTTKWQEESVMKRIRTQTSLFQVQQSLLRPEWLAVGTLTGIRWNDWMNSVLDTPV